MRVSIWSGARLIGLAVVATALAVPASVLAAAPAAGAGPSAEGQQQHQPVTLPEIGQPQPGENPPPLTPKQQRQILKSNFEKMKHDADELAALAKSLQQDLDKSNQNVLSLQVVDKAERIEKLAKKIKSAAIE